jgi:hypothetical protein
MNTLTIKTKTTLQTNSRNKTPSVYWKKPLIPTRSTNVLLQLLRLQDTERLVVLEVKATIKKINRSYKEYRCGRTYTFNYIKILSNMSCGASVHRANIERLFAKKIGGSI